jgi:hypothetical protein
MKKRLTTLVAGLALGGSLIIAGTGSVAAVGALGGPSGNGVCSTQAAAARTTPTVESLRAFGDCEIGRRLTTLGTLASKVSGSKTLTSSDASALSSEISATVSGLNALKATIDAETAVPALKADVAKVATQFRVYVLVVPQVHLVSAADGVLAAQAKFTQINTNLAARIAKAKTAGKDVTAAQTALDAMNTHVSQAMGLATGLPAKLLALTPAQYNAGTAGPVLAGARTALATARNDLKAAVADAQACRAALKALGS